MIPFRVTQNRSRSMRPKSFALTSAGFITTNAICIPVLLEMRFILPLAMWTGRISIIITSFLGSMILRILLIRSRLLKTSNVKSTII